MRTAQDIVAHYQALSGVVFTDVTRRGSRYTYRLTPKPSCRWRFAQRPSRPHAAQEPAFDCWATVWARR